MKECELCGGGARMYCESDQAILCWDCDEKVHCANFLVARHSRSLLCHVCQSPTPWKASGARFCPTVSVCESCVESHNRKRERGGDEESRGGNDQNEDENDDPDGDDDDDGDDDGDGDDFDEEYEEDDEEDGDNQVVPWSGGTPPPAVTSSSSEEECSSRFYFLGSGGGSTLKRVLENASDLDSEDERGCSSSRLNHNSTSFHIVSPSDNEEASFSSSIRPWKQPRLCELNQSQRDQDRGETESRSTAIISSLKRLQNHVISVGEEVSETIIGICKLSRDQSR